jgi:hypothetical protein
MIGLEDDYRFAHGARLNGSRDASRRTTVDNDVCRIGIGHSNVNGYG